jgi:hypothetical protein
LPTISGGASSAARFFLGPDAPLFGAQFATARTDGVLDSHLGASPQLGYRQAFLARYLRFLYEMRYTGRSVSIPT